MTLFLLLLSFLSFVRTLRYDSIVHAPACNMKIYKCELHADTSLSFHLFGFLSFASLWKVCKCPHARGRAAGHFRFELMAKTFTRDIWSYSDPFEPMVRYSVLIVHRGNRKLSNVQFGHNCAEEMNRLGCWRARC